MTDNNHQEKKLAFLLRHDTSYPFDSHGWREVNDLVTNHGFSPEELVSIVSHSDKQRFEFSADGRRIRARQGHSIDVDVDLEEAVPPDSLFHGTSSALVPRIMREGLRRMSRQYVHLSANEATAFRVGARRKGMVAVLRVNALAMRDDGHRFLLARNGVWLVKEVPPQYIEITSTATTSDASGDIPSTAKT